MWRVRGRGVAVGNLVLLDIEPQRVCGGVGVEALGCLCCYLKAGTVALYSHSMLGKLCVCVCACVCARACACACVCVGVGVGACVCVCVVVGVRLICLCLCV